MQTASDIVKLKRFCQEIIDKPRSMYEQPWKSLDDHIWCQDWEIIEILKYLFLGRETYMAEPPPNRLKHNPLWSKEAIEEKAEELLITYESTDEIIEQLRSIRNGTASGVR